MRLTDYATLNFNKYISTAAVFLDIEKAFDTTRRFGLLHKLRKLHFSTSLIKLVISFLPTTKLKVSAQGKISTPTEIQTDVP
jgi:hypothetical protein